MYRGEDGSFADVMYAMLCNIPDSREKAMAKLEFQQKLIQLKCNIPAGAPNTPTFNNLIHQTLTVFQAPHHTTHLFSNNHTIIFICVSIILKETFFR